MEPCYNEVLGTMKITLLYQVSHYIRVKKQRNIKSWDQQNYLVIRGFCYIWPLYNEVPLYKDTKHKAFLLYKDDVPWGTFRLCGLGVDREVLRLANHCVYALRMCHGVDVRSLPERTKWNQPNWCCPLGSERTSTSWRMRSTCFLM